jgi:hypothetical protein
VENFGRELENKEKEKEQKTISYFPILLTVLSIAGVVLNIYKLTICFYLWMGANFGWAILNFTAYRKYREPTFLWQGILFTVYFALAIYGIAVWTV